MKIPEPSFALKEPNGKNETLLYLKVYLDYKRITISTGVKILPEVWDNKNGTIKSDKRLLNNLEKDYPGITNKVKAIESKILDYKRAFERAVTKLNMLHEKFEAKELKNQIEREIGREPVVKKKTTLNEYIDQYVKDMEDGRRLSPNGKRFSKNTTKNYKNFLGLLKSFEKFEHKNIDFDDINPVFREKFVRYLLKEGYSPNTIWRYFKELKAIMNLAFEEGLHTNLSYRTSKFRMPQVQTTEIYLTEKELDAMYNA